MDAIADDFVKITYDGDRITSKMPPDESIVIVRFDDGTERRAWFGCNIMDAGDYDFVPLDDGSDEPGDADSIADRVVAWRLPS